MKREEKELYNLLNELGIDFKKVEHPAFFTCDESENFYQNNNLGVDCKNVFLRNRRGKKHYLVVVQASKKIDIPVLAEFLGENKKMGFASEKRLKNFLGLTPGSVTPFGIINDKNGEVSVVVDKKIFKHEFAHFHPMRNTATLKISTDDLRRFLMYFPNDFLEFDFK